MIIVRDVYTTRDLTRPPCKIYNIIIISYYQLSVHKYDFLTGVRRRRRRRF